MSKPLTEYFKVIRTPQAMPKITKRKLSLNRKSTPQKTSKVSPDHSASIVDLTWDHRKITNFEETVCKNEINNSLNDQETSQNSNECEEESNSSDATIVYTPETPRKFETPTSTYSKSPRSQDKFFSPGKKKSVKLRSPSKAKKNLSSIMDAKKEEGPLFHEACSWRDDKTMFLLNIINKYLTTDELRPLLLQQSQDLLTKCMNSKQPAMKIVCRLYWRKEGWYRLDQIKDISKENKDSMDDAAVLDAIDYLTKNDILQSSNYKECTGSNCEMELKDRLTLLKVDELRSICKELKIKAANKPDSIESLMSFSKQKTNISSYFVGHKTDNASRLLKLITEKTGPCFKLTATMRQTLYELYQLMYLGMSPDVIKEKKLELTLIYHKIKRECYPDINVRLDNASVVFRTRQDFERYLQAQKTYDEFIDATDVTDKCCIVENVYSLYRSIDATTMLSYKALPLWLHKFTPPYLYVKILGAGLQELKKLKTDASIALAVDIASLLIAQNTFRQDKKAEWYLEKALILDKFMSDAEQAAKVLLAGFESGLPEEYQDSLRPRAALLAARRTRPVPAALREALLRHASHDILESTLDAVHIYKNPMDVNQSRGKVKFETRTADGRLVQDAEAFCLHWYIASGKYTHGGHWEGQVVQTLFFLLFWDLIYADLPGVRGLFLTHYQMFPLDMFVESFYANRRALIEDRLRDIEQASTEDLLARLERVWNSRPETELSGISRGVGWAAVGGAARGLRPRALAAVCGRLARRYRHARTGFPDLTLWNVHTDEIKLVEVKTDADSPSLRQLQWMHFLRAHGVPAEFCYVGVNTTRTVMFAVYVPLALMSAVSAVSVVYLYCKNRIQRRQGYMDVTEKP